MLWEEVLDPNSELGQIFMKCWELERELKGVEDPELELAENFTEHREVERQLEGLMDPCSKFGLKFAEYRDMRSLRRAKEKEERQREVCREIQSCLDTIEGINQERLLVNAELEVLEARG